ncbi:MAG: hypothetical protein ACLFNQ_00635 [Spirochaetaceae bacterium]
MSKAHRGSGIRDQYNHGRGTCPITGKTGVKLMYEHEIDGKKVMISKAAKAHITNQRRRQERAGKAAGAAAEAQTQAKAAQDAAPTPEAESTETASE